MELVSVLICVYKEPINWIEISLRSIIEQSHKNIEIIIVVDAPERNDVIQLLTRLSLCDERIKPIVNAENIGLTKSLNKGLLFCQGQFIARMDADDISVNCRIEKQLNYLQGNKEIILCGTNILEFNELMELKEVKYPSSNNEILNRLVLEPSFAHPSIMFRRKYVEKIIGREKLYDEKFLVAQDYKLYADLLGEYAFGNVQEVLLYYRRSCHQVSIVRKNEQIKNSKICRGIVYNYLKCSGTKKFNNLIILEWLSKKEYNFKDAISFIFYGTWRFFNFTQLLALIKRFLKGSQPLLD